MTYKPRLLKKQKGYITNGSIAILKNKSDYKITQKQLEYISSKEFRDFYTIARNYQTRSLNIDNLSVFWFGINKEI
ncbi:type II restriction modification system adenine/cytosine DNA methyltransferase subunit [Mycoplasma feriruminatoris]|nr:type II restriction modification system adenine/cytosine DNA methyltransferase subunit [Mycoplasma feriruminatoris]